MTNSRAIFARTCGAVLSLALTGTHAAAQSQPARIPTVVAQAMIFLPEIFGKPQFFDGRLPTGWPAELVPPGARIVGGGIVGDQALFRVEIAVFALPAQGNPEETLRALLTKSGYLLVKREAETQSGFMSSMPLDTVTAYCKGSSHATFRAVDASRAPLVFLVALQDGQAGRQNCTPQPAREVVRRYPIELPTLVPPAGSATFGGQGGSWGSDGGSIHSTLRTTMPGDSILAHYTAQLVTSGWKTSGRPALGEGIGAQRFSFRNAQEDWAAALLVITVGDRREIRLEFSRSP